MTTPPQYFMPDGQPSAPGMPFADNHEDGIYHPAGGAFGIAVNGARGVEVDNDGNLKLMTADAGVLDANGDSIGLTGWSTDADGNLVNSGGGRLVANSFTEPIEVSSHYTVAGPSTRDAGVFFRLSSPNWSGVPAAPLSMLEVDDYNGEVSLLGMSVAFRASAAGHAQLGELRMQEDSAALSVLTGGALSALVKLTGGRLEIGDVTPAWPIQLNAPMLAQDGTAAVPALAFITDLNTGLFSAGADTLAFATGGVGRWFIDAAGDLNDAGGSNINLVGGHLSMSEVSDPAAPAATIALLYAKDVGGKVALMCRFPTGSVQQIAIEP